MKYVGVYKGELAALYLTLTVTYVTIPQLLVMLYERVLVWRLFEFCGILRDGDVKWARNGGPGEWVLENFPRMSCGVQRFRRFGHGMRR